MAPSNRFLCPFLSEAKETLLFQNSWIKTKYILQPPQDPKLNIGPLKSPQRAPFSHISISVRIRYAAVYQISDVPKMPVK